MKKWWIVVKLIQTCQNHNYNWPNNKNKRNTPKFVCGCYCYCHVIPVVIKAPV